MRNKPSRDLFLRRAAAVAALVLWASALSGCPEDEEGDNDQQGQEQEAACADGADDDGDGATDCDDDDCAADPACAQPQQERCGDGQDNDGDGDADCDDADCADEPACAEVDPCAGVVCDAPGVATCDGEVAVTQGEGACVEGQCVYQAERADCAASGQVCRGGACVDPPDPCEGVTCDAPPASTCDGDVLMTYGAPGACVNGECLYEGPRLDCAADGQVCRDGACVDPPDPCEGVVCDAPPAATCDGDLAIGYADEGSCAEGECSYEVLQANCADTGQVCQEGACVDPPDPCEGVVCDAPPAAACQGQVAVTYNAQGACLDGACQYQPTQTDCAATQQACLDGACVARAPERCDDDLDNDGDDLTDCADQDCLEDLACANDPCRGVACDTPPTAICEGLIAISYAPRGVCEEGQCTYEATRADCGVRGLLCQEGACVTRLVERCDDAQDNDGDGDADCDDADCAQEPACAPDPCQNVTCDFPPNNRCEGAVAISYPPRGQCVEGRCDYSPQRLDCAALGQLCQGGFCASPPPEICDDLVDNDGDGAVDCDDDGCADAPNCDPATLCASACEALVACPALQGACEPSELEQLTAACGPLLCADNAFLQDFILTQGALGCDEGAPELLRFVQNNQLCVPESSCLNPRVIDQFISNGSTLQGQEGQNQGSCGGESGVEEVWVVTFTGDYTVCAETVGADFDTVLYVREGDCAEGAEIACGDDLAEEVLQSQVQFEARQGVPYFLFVDGFDAQSAGAYPLTLRLGPCDVAPGPEVCGDAVDNDQNGATDCDDGDCVGQPACTSCEAPGVIAQDGLVQGSNLGILAPEAVWSLQVEGIGTPSIVCAHTEGSDFDTYLAVRRDTCDGAIIAGNDNAPGGSWSEVQFAAFSSVTYFITVRGAQGEQGNYNIWFSSGPCDGTQAGPERCGDLLDNDLDGAADCADPDCVGDPACAFIEQCRQDCDVVAACPELADACLPGDLESFREACYGPICADPSQREFLRELAQAPCAESSAAVLTSLRGAGLCLEGVEQCADGVDNDDDGLVDCDDEGDCAMNTACLPQATCQNPLFVADFTNPGNTREAAHNQFTGSCGPRSSGNDDVWELNVGLDATICVDTVGANFDTVLYVREGDCAAGPEIACNDDLAVAEPRSRVEVEVRAGNRYFFIVDGATRADQGLYSLNLRIGPCDAQPAPEVCDDALDNDFDGVADCQDSDCLNDRACFAGSCEDPLLILQPGAVTGDTSAATSQYAASCVSGASVSPEEVWTFQLPPGLNSPVCLDTFGSAFDTVLYVRAADCADSPDIACNDDALAPTLTQSRVQIDAIGGLPYFVFVDGYNADHSGAYVLNAALGECPVIVR